MIALDAGGAEDRFFRAVLHQLYVNPNSHGIIRTAGIELEKRKDLLKVILNIRGDGNRSSRPKVMLPEVMLPETGVMLPEIHCHVARNPESCRPKFYRVYKLEKK